MKTIDLNVDVGEGFEHDVALLDYATSVNIACGWHAGNALTMQQVASAALRRGVAIGAHPSFPDRKNFGRSAMKLAPDEVYAGVQYQVGALATIVAALGGRLAHVKPHGALYNQAETDRSLADAIVRAVGDMDADLAIFGLANGQLVRVARSYGLIAIDEAFADRGYTPAGTLVPRSEPMALIEDDEQACAQAISMVCDGSVRTNDGSWVDVTPQSLCLHGDGAHALVFADAIRSALGKASVVIARPVVQQHTVSG